MVAVLDEDEVLEVIKADTGSAGTVVSFTIDPVGDNPSGFLGEHKRLKVKHGNGETFYFVKKIPDAAASAQRRYLQQTRCFYKEINLYRTVFAALEADVKREKWHPKFYYSRGEELMVLEDLTRRGFYMHPDRELLNEEHILHTLDAMARMHACSIIYEARKTGTTIGEEFGEFLFETVATAEEGHPGNRSHETAISAQLQIIDLLDGYTNKQKEIIKRELPFRMRRLYQLVKPSKKFRNVVVHGDLWSNNVLFRADNGRVITAEMIDFQLSRYAPPVHDIVMFLYLVQNKKFRDENHFRLLRYYYDSLSSCLETNGLKPRDCLTWYELLGTWDYYEELGVVTAVFFFQLILVPPDLCAKYFSTGESALTVPDRRAELVVECFNKDRVYRERVVEVMNELIHEYIL